MRYEYILYTTDSSFSYGDFPNSTFIDIEQHGFSLDIDKDDKVDITSIRAFGDCSYELSSIKTEKELIEFIFNNIDKVEREEIVECLNELVFFLKKQSIKIKKSKNRKVA